MDGESSARLRARCAKGLWWTASVAAVLRALWWGCCVELDATGANPDSAAGLPFLVGASFLALGVGTVSARLSWRPLAFVAAAGLIALGGFTLVDGFVRADWTGGFALGVTRGGDAAPLPSRLGMREALCLLVLGVALALDASQRMSWRGAWARLGLASIVVGVAGYSILEHVLGTQMRFAWWRLGSLGLVDAWVLALVAVAIGAAAFERLNRLREGPLVLRVAWPGLIAAVLVSLALGHQVNEEVDRGVRRIFDVHCEDLEGRLAASLGRCERALRGIQGLFRASEVVRDDEWRVYLETQRVRELHPGFDWFAFAEVREPSRWQEATPPGGLIIRLIDSSGDSVAPRPGDSPLSDEIYREAMLRARETGDVALSARVDLAPVRPGQTRPGFLMVLPVFQAPSGDARSGGGPGSDESLVGFVHAAARLDRILADGEGHVDDAHVSVQVFDGPEARESSRLHRSVTSAESTSGVEGRAPVALATRVMTREYGGRPWTLRMETLPAFHAEVGRLFPEAVSMLGLLISFLLFALHCSLATTRSRAEELAEGLADARAEVDQKMRVLVDTAAAGIFTLRSSGAVLTANRVAEELFGYDDGELLGRPIEALFALGAGSDAGETPAVRLGRLASDAERARFETVATRRDGGRFPVHVSLGHYHFEERQYYTAIVLDTTARVRAEEALRGHAKELERRNEELDSFAYIASHDLRSPLRAIDRLAAWIEEDSGHLLGDKSHEHLRRLRQRVARMENLLRDLLAFSRAGRIESSVEEFNLADLLEDALSTLSVPERFQVRLVGTFPTVRAHRAPLLQVALNLIANAIKHHDREDGLLELRCQDEAECVEVVFRDDGPGIPRELHGRIFEMFQTLRPRDEVEGSGMGLAIVKKILERFGGDIRLESESGRGATFLVRWPKEAETIECIGVTA